MMQVFTNIINILGCMSYVCPGPCIFHAHPPFNESGYGPVLDCGALKWKFHFSGLGHSGSEPFNYYAPMNVMPHHPHWGQVGIYSGI